MCFQQTLNHGLRQCHGTTALTAADVESLNELTRIMVSKGMVSKSKYWISEKNKGIPVSIFTESVLTFFQLCFIRVWSLGASTGFPEK